MRMEKRDSEWIRILQAKCPACDTEVEAERKKWFRGRKCWHCGYYVDKVYFD